MTVDLWQRPPVGARTSHLQIRVTPGQKRRLRTLARRSGKGMSEYVIERALPPFGARFAGLLDELRRGAEPRFVLAELNDFLVTLERGEFAAGVAAADLGGLAPWLANYVAAMVERAAGRLGAIPPAWVRAVEPLAEPYFAAPLTRLREHLLRASPVPFKRRNLFVDSSVGDRV
jgi:hypothetical protein